MLSSFDQLALRSRVGIGGSEADGAVGTTEALEETTGTAWPRLTDEDTAGSVAVAVALPKLV